MGRGVDRRFIYRSVDRLEQSVRSVQEDARGPRGRGISPKSQDRGRRRAADARRSDKPLVLRPRVNSKPRGARQAGAQVHEEGGRRRAREERVGVGLEVYCIEKLRVVRTRKYGDDTP